MLNLSTMITLEKKDEFDPRSYYFHKERGITANEYRKQCHLINRHCCCLLPLVVKNLKLKWYHQIPELRCDLFNNLNNLLTQKSN